MIPRFPRRCVLSFFPNMKKSTKAALFLLPGIASWFLAGHYLSGGGTLLFHAAVAEAKHLVTGSGKASASLFGDLDQRLSPLEASNAANDDCLLALLAEIERCSNVSALRSLYESLKEKHAPSFSVLAAALQRRLVELDPDLSVVISLRDRSSHAKSWPAAICDGWAVFQTDERLLELMTGLAADFQRFEEDVASSWFPQAFREIGKRLGPERVLRLALASNLPAGPEGYDVAFHEAAKVSPAATQAHLAKVTDPALRVAAEQGYLKGLAEANPAAALAVLKDLPPGPVVTAILSQLAQSDDAALQTFLAANPQYAKQTPLTLVAENTKNPERWLTWGDTNLEGTARHDFNAGLTQHHIQTHPEAAVAALDRLPSSRRQDTIDSILHGNRRRLGEPLPPAFVAAVPELQNLPTTEQLVNPAWPATHAQALEQLARVRNSRDSQTLLQAYSQHDPAFAWKLARAAQQGQSIETPLLEAWSREDPRAAATWLHEHPTEADDEQHRIALHYLRDADPALAKQWEAERRKTP
jgi:hypothetical protein